MAGLVLDSSLATAWCFPDERSEYTNNAVRFSAIAAEIDDFERGLSHLETAVLARATCRGIDAGDLDQVQAHIGFVDERLSDAGSDLENTVYVSYLENVFSGSEDPRSVSARAMLSNRLQNAPAELEAH